MKKKILFGVIATALVALNALAFSAPSSALPPEPPVTNGCFQTTSYACEPGVLRKACTQMNTKKQCKEFYCSSCAIHWKPLEEIDFMLDPSKTEIEHKP